MIDKTHIWEQAIINLLNLDGWDLEWTGSGFEHYDAKGKTPKGFDCIIEFKLRNKYYYEKVLEKDKYDNLMSFKGLKFYYVFDCKGNYLYFLNELKMPLVVKSQMPCKTYFENKQLIEKEVYFLSESNAIIINKN